MAQIQPVEYIKNSSTAGFAVAGDEKTITSDNANTIQKDVSQGNTKDLTVAQEKYLKSNVDKDTLDYSVEEMEKSGENKIDTTGEGGESLEEKDQKGGAASAATGAAVGAAGAAAMAIITATSSVEAVAKAGSSIPGGMLAAGLVAAVGAGVAYACSFENTFDPNLAERKTQTSNAETNNNIINNYVKILDDQMDEINENSDKYREVLASQTETNIQTRSQTTAIDGEMMALAEQGLPIIDLEKQKSKIQKRSNNKITADSEELTRIKESMSDYTAKNAEASGVKTSGDTVAQFLNEGKQMQNFAKAAQIASYVGVAVMALGVTFSAMRIGVDLAGIFTAPFAGLDNAGLVLFVAGGVLMGLAANNFGTRANDEGAAADAGSGMAENLSTLGQYIDANSQTVGTASEGIKEQDNEAGEKIAESEENAKEANNGGQVPSTRSGKNPADKKPPINNVA